MDAARADNQQGEMFSRLGAIEFAGSCISKDSFDALLEPGLHAGEGVLLRSIDALGGVAKSLLAEGEPI
jgi:hypothetical protein